MKYLLQLFFIFCLLQACQPPRDSVHFAHLLQIEQDSLRQFSIGDTISETRLKTTIARLRNKLGARPISLNLDSVQVFIGETEIQFYEAQTDTLIYVFSDDTTKTFFQDKTAKKIFRRVSELSKNNLQAYKSNDYFYIQIATEALRDGKTRLVIASNELKYDVLLFERISADTWVLAAIEDSRGNQEAKDWD
jgi:hypothetical protein